MSQKLDEIGSETIPKTIWTLTVEKVKNDSGKDEYIISIPEKLRKHLKLKEGDNVFWGERMNNCCEVRKAKKEELNHFNIKLGHDNAIRQAKTDRYIS